ncbi:hypothetical protein T492DRAFT_869466 [Pavlovales sp. CCMP2436]|nr:hypothetical protein T492DRAFT_869466 [Pavlovales sp. CCMP2436]|mmetsp:Transcript_31073/g.76706  ORF Transcript_31073/g.76706 Transcript_31073/m.76706 type:complete len:132 (+) Transcript_31073:35-430(+)
MRAGQLALALALAVGLASGGIAPLTVGLASGGVAPPATRLGALTQPTRRAAPAHHKRMAQRMPAAGPGRPLRERLMRIGLALAPRSLAFNVLPSSAWRRSPAALATRSSGPWTRLARACDELVVLPMGVLL